MPQFDNNAWTVYEYNPNDTLQSVTDPRGAKTSYSYNKRKLVTQKHYSQFTPAPADENFTYDGAGNRTSMQDGTGALTYAYDQLSRLTSETRTFSGLSAGPFTLNYSYNRANRLTGVSDPFGGAVSYHHDVTGRMSSVTGAGFGDTSQFMSNLQYRAWGAKKHFTSGNGVEMSFGYNARLSGSGYTVSNLSNNTTPTVSYIHYADGQLKFAGTGSAAQPDFFDRAYVYDHAGRVQEALSGNEAHGLATANGPYKQSYGFDVWGNTTALTSRLYNQTSAQHTPHTNGRRNDWGGCYDAAGHIIQEGWNVLAPMHTLDAAERHVNFESNDQPAHLLFNSSLEIAHSFDGNGATVKQATTRRSVEYDGNGLPFAVSATTDMYYLRSSVMGGQVVAELNALGLPENRYIYAEGLRIASVGGGQVTAWHFTDPATGTQYWLNGWAGERQFTAYKQLDPLGMDVTTDPALAQQYAPPIYTEPLRDLLNPLQIEGSWTGELESGMAEYEGRLQNTRDTIAAREAWKKGDRQTWEAILARNPNVGIEGTKFERAEDGRWRVLYTFSAWGGDAAKFLGVLSRELIAGRWMDAAQGEIYLAHPPDKEWNAPLRGKQKTIVDNTIKDADELLSNNNCASAVTGLTTSVESSPQAQEVLRTVRFRYSGVAPGAVATTEGNNDTGRRANVAYIGIYDVFFKEKVLKEAYSRTFGIEGYSINQLRVLAILHELRHTFTGPHRGATFQETVAENNQWNQTILAACFGTNKTRARNK